MAISQDLLKQVTSDLKVCEGLRLDIYRDTVGLQTIGYGWCIDRSSMRECEAEFRLHNDIVYHYDILNKNYPWFKDLSDGRKGALINMQFNLGVKGLSLFTKMLVALARGEYKLASEHALNSKWAKQVGNRAKRIAEVLRNGE